MNALDLFHGPNAGYMLERYEQYRADPQSVDPQTRAFFDRLTPSETPIGEQPGESGPSVQGQQPSPSSSVPSAPSAPSAPSVPSVPSAPATSCPPRGVHERLSSHGGQPENGHPAGDSRSDNMVEESFVDEEGAITKRSRTLGEVVESHIPDIVSAARLVRFIREIGHLAAKIEPLGSPPPGDPGLSLESQELSPDKLMRLPANVVRSPLAKEAKNALEAIELMREVYCGTIGYEDDHVQVHEERAWIRRSAETRRFFEPFEDQCKREILERLTETESFERFLHQIYPGQKRFSIEGNDMLIPILNSVIHQSATAGTREVVIGMAHRGRLNVLAHILGKPYSAILAEFQGPNYYNKGTYQGWTGDVKYHLGARRAYRESGIFEMPLTLSPNPSHLESINPVVKGRARAAQEQRNKPGIPLTDQNASLPVLIHGDASFPGQGMVAESLNLSHLCGYHIGGTIHIIINNQIGFTTNWRDSRSTLYASDLAKGFAIPIVHVNADDPLACIVATRMAWAYRERFHKDFVIDLVGYRRWGHNEGDEPSFTQPLMYDRITPHPTVRELWARRLEEEGVIAAGEADKMVERVWSRLQRALHEVNKGGRIEATMAMSVNTLLHRPVSEPQHISREQLIELDESLLQMPEGFNPQPKLAKQVERRRTIREQPDGIDWAHAEQLAFATILSSGTPIRLTGQDVERGTFSQRHLVLHDVKTGQRHVPLQSFEQSQAAFAVYNSPLSENATLGFEYGYSSHAPDVLVLWEAQFGDFCNGAQIVIDQFIVSGAAKWGQTPALVLLLPHGYEGQGPEHSSARLERFLQLAADNNVRIVNCTTAAQYYHLLRRQASMLQSDPRPLIVMTPKSLLRNPLAASSLEDLAEGKFYPVLPPLSGSDNPRDVVRLILCSGKVYMDFISNGTEEAPLPPKIAAARVEELYPLPIDDLEVVINQYPNIEEIVWLQEEPHNMGAWTYMEPRLRELAARIATHRHSVPLPIRYCGRPESASPAEGSLSLHKQEQSRILREVVSFH